MKKKIFVYALTESKKSQRTGSIKKTYAVHEIKNNKPVPVDTVTFNTGSCRGTQSEIFIMLLNKGLVKANKDNSQYYTPTKNKSFELFEIN